MDQNLGTSLNIKIDFKFKYIHVHVIVHPSPQYAITGFVPSPDLSSIPHPPAGSFQNKSLQTLIATRPAQLPRRMAKHVTLQEKEKLSNHESPSAIYFNELSLLLRFCQVKNV
jgi:hypothetical protein